VPKNERVIDQVAGDGGNARALNRIHREQSSERQEMQLMQKDQTSQTGNGRAVLLLIAGVPLTMILAASWLWYFVIHGDIDLVGAIGTANNGQLITPRSIRDVALVDDTGAPLAWSDLDPRWTLVVANHGMTCDRDCERRLYITRQIHVALGRDFNRVRRAFVNDSALADMRVAVPTEPVPGWPEGAGDNFRDYLMLAHSGLVAVTVQPAQFEFLFQHADQVRPAAGWYLVDPAGWVMMYFPDALDYKAVITDLKFLLKNSGG